MGFTLGRGHPFPAGTTVTAYEDIGQKPEGVPNGLVVIDTAVVAGDLARTLTFDDLAAEKRYYAVAQVGSTWRWVSFRTVSDAVTTTDLAAHEADTTNIHGIADTGEIGYINEAPLNPRAPEFGAVGDDIVNDRAAIQACLDAAGTADNGEVYIEPVSAAYRISDGDPSTGHGLTGRNGTRIVGGGYGSQLHFPNDLGAGKYAFNVEQGEANKLPTLAHLYLKGLPRPASPAGGIAPAQMYGFRLWRGWTLFHCNAEGFMAGHTVEGDHARVWGGYYSNNKYGQYVKDAPGRELGDCSVIGVNLDGNTDASVGVAGDCVIDGWTYLACHFGYGPECFRKLTKIDRDFILNTKIIRSAFEGFRYGVFTAQGGNPVFSVELDGCQGGSHFTPTADYAIAGRTGNALIDIGSGFGSLIVRGLDTVMTQPGATHAFIGNFDSILLENATALIDSCVSGGKKFSTVTPSTSRLRYGGADARVIRANDVIAKNALIERSNESHYEYGQDAVDPVPAGVALMAAVNGDDIPAVYRGRVSVKCDTAEITAGGKRLVGNETENGEVIVHTPGTNDYKVIGYSCAAAASNLVTAMVNLP